MSRLGKDEPTLQDLRFRLEVLGPATTDSSGGRQIGGVVSWMMSRPDERPELGVRVFVVVEPGATDAETEERLWSQARNQAGMFAKHCDPARRDTR